MKPHLLVGLGNLVMGDDGIGVRVAGELADDPRLEEFETCEGGTDILQLQDRFLGRRSIVLVDATFDGQEPGTVTLIRGADVRSPSSRHCHHLCMSECLSLMRVLDPRLDDVPIGVFLISILRAELSPELSPLLSGRLPRIVETIRSRLVDAGPAIAR